MKGCTVKNSCCLSNGECNIQDYQTRKKCCIATFRREEKSYFKDAIRLFATNKDVKAFNEEKLKELKQPIV